MQERPWLSTRTSTSFFFTGHLGISKSGSIGKSDVYMMMCHCINIIVIVVVNTMLI